MKKKTTVDPVAGEVRRVRARLSAKFRHDIHAIAADIRARQKGNPRLVPARRSRGTV